MKDGCLPVEDGELFFEQGGEGEPVVFLHGFGLDARMWAPQFETLQASFHVVRYDLRGFGRSSLPAAKGYAHEDDLYALLSHLRAVPAHLVGLSMGGRMALRFALTYPESVRSMVLAESALDGYSWSSEWRQGWNRICEAARAGRFDEAKRQWLEHSLFDAARANSLTAQLLSSMIQDYTGWHWANSDSARVFSPPVSERLSEIRIPSLLINGSRSIGDFHSIAAILSKRLRTVRCLTIEGSGHMVNLETPNEFNAGVLSFWKDIGCTLGL